MIFDKIENINLYRGLQIRIDEVINLIESHNFDEAESGKIIVDGDHLYYLVQSYDTQITSDLKLETHRKYIDLQFVVKGEEIMGYANKSELRMVTDYDTEKDIQFFEGSYLPLNVKEGYFAIFFPEDAHKPGQSVGEVKPVKKIVFKIEVNK